ncbi:DUF892 family protein [Candidatus Parcubacteria bacterium]|nr:DUF892 family protein [Candidatus Parcubacteria bacterium]
MNKLKALYDIESVIIDNLPKLAEAATDNDLKKVLNDHLKETKDQSKRLEEAFKLLGETPDRLESEAIRGLVKDAEWCVENIEEGDQLDLALIGAASYVEHYEMAGYNSARMLAEASAESEVADLLDATFTEEETADMKLSDLATIISGRLSS